MADLGFKQNADCSWGTLPLGLNNTQRVDASRPALDTKLALSTHEALFPFPSSVLVLPAALQTLSVVTVCLLSLFTNSS